MKHLRRVVSHLSMIVTLFAAGTVAAEERELAVALGDSVAFGFITQDGYAYVNPDNFVGYPEYLGQMLHLDTVNAACPGEATTGFLSPTGADNGCDGFKASFPLHVSYNGATTQLAFATALLNKDRHKVRLVTINLGANDGLLLEQACSYDPSCIGAGLPTLKVTVITNIEAIIADLRATGFEGPIIVINYYSTDYTNQNTTALVSYLNSAISEAAAASGAVVANVFRAFRVASTAAGGKTCVAGLLNVDPTNSALPSATCDEHPSQSGQRLIARTIAREYAALR